MIRPRLDLVVGMLRFVREVCAPPASPPCYCEQRAHIAYHRTPDRHALRRRRAS